MIECTHCETSQFLQIIESRTLYRDGDLVETSERYECTRCGATGTYSMDPDTERLSGQVTHKPTRPLTMEAF